MDINLVALVSTIVTSISLGLMAFLRGPDRPVNRYFTFHSLVVACWVALTIGAGWSQDADTVIIYLKLVHFASAFVLSTFIDFVWAFPDQLRPGPRKRRYLLHSLAAVFGGLCLLPALVRSSVVLTPIGPDVAFGWPLAVFALWGFAAPVHANLVLIHKARMQQGVARVQTLYVLAGALISELFILTTTVVLPVVTGHTAYSRWGAAGYLVTVVAISIAIAKYRLWNLGGVTRRVVAAALAVGTIFPLGGIVLWFVLQQPHLSLTGWGYGIMGLIVGAATGLLLIPVYRGFLGLVAGVDDPYAERVSQLLGALGKAITEWRPGAQPLSPILSATRRFFGCDFVEVFLRTGSGAYRSMAIEQDPSAGDRWPTSHRRLPRFITNTINADALDHPLEVAQLARFGAVEDSAALLAVMEDLNANVIVPIRWEKATIGLLVVGPRASRDMYYLPDVELLETIADHVAVAVKAAELRAQLISEKERTEKVLGQIQSGVIAVDAARIIRVANPAACLLLNCQESDLKEHGIGVLPRVLRMPLLRALDAGVVVTGQSVYLTGEDAAPGASGRVRLACSTFILHGPDGKTEGGGIVFNDMSTEDALRQAEQETERLRFIRALSAGLAHEIRNPLVAIRTFAELAPTRLDDPEFRDSFFKVAQSEIHRLEELVSQFMTLARPARPATDRVDLRKLAESVATTVMAQAQQSDVAVTAMVADGLPAYRGDESRLYQALLNLAQNAVDATPPGGRVEVRAEYRTMDGRRVVSGGSGPAPGELVLTVWNSGSYIPPDERQRLFEPFYTKKSGGTGLGLAIVQTIATEHGGQVTVDSDPERGTSFALRLPVSRPSALLDPSEQAETAVVP